MGDEQEGRVDVVVPRWGLSMEEAIVVCWLKMVGDVVKEGEALLELETDKANAEVESPASGVLVEQLAEPDDEVVPGQLLGRIQSAGATS